MKLSVKSDYAARAVLGLARHYQSGQAMKVDVLAEAHSIPSNYLVQILIELKSSQIVKSLRGKSGGYLLARAPAQISFGDVLRSLHGEVFDTQALNDSNCPAELHQAWRTLQESLDKAANSINFQMLLDQENSRQRMYYI